MKKIFVDLGANKGQSVDWFLEKYPNAKEFEIHMFEPNKILWEGLKDYKGILHKEVAWIHDGFVAFYYADLTAGSTLIEGKRTGGVHYEKPESLPCIDFGKWIRQFEDDYVMVKMNIEGAEYGLLGQMIRDGSISYINELYVQYHHGKIDGINVGDTRKLNMILNKMETLKYAEFQKRVQLFRDYL